MPPLFYLRTNNELEVDLLIEEAFEEFIVVEFKLSKTPSRKMASGIQRFRSLFPKLKITSGMVVCLVDEDDDDVPLLANVNATTVEHFLDALVRK